MLAGYPLTPVRCCVFKKLKKRKTKTTLIPITPSLLSGESSSEMSADFMKKFLLKNENFSAINGAKTPFEFDQSSCDVITVCESNEKMTCCTPPTIKEPTVLADSFKPSEKSPKKVGQPVVKAKSKTITKGDGSPTVCPFCPATFAKSQSLGGHVSKKHRGMSNKYANKMQVRDRRTPKRQLLREAQGIILKKDPSFCFKTNCHRPLMNALKKCLKN
jgi:hypothetical protein